jgi:2,3-bisphosphoglycerate-dependent phosphoglycerate mutase
MGLFCKLKRAPLATHLGLSRIEMDEALPIKNDILSNHAGQTVPVMGHSDTVPDIIKRLGAGSVPVIDDGEFDNLFVVKVFSPNQATLTRLKY